MAAQRCVYLEIVGGAGKPGHREKARIEPDKRGGSLALNRKTAESVAAMSLPASPLMLRGCAGARPSL